MWHASRSTQVAKVDVQRLDLSLIEPFSISGGSPTVAANVMVRVELADGSFGFGEAAPFEAVSGETQDATYAALIRARSSVIGRDAIRWRTISTALGQTLPSNPAARCALEQALVDAVSRHLGISLNEFFGGPGDGLVTDLTITASSVEHAVERAVQATTQGFETLKVKVGAQRWSDDVDRLVAIRDAVPDARLVADGNEGFTWETASHFLRALEANRVHLSLLEQPVPASEIDCLAAIEREFDVPVCADESVRSPHDAIKVATTGSISFINVKLMKLGVVGAVDVLAISAGAGIKCMMGGMIESRVSMSFSAALAMAWGDLIEFVDLDTPLFMDSDCATGGIKYSGPSMTLDQDASGTGITRVECFGQ